jgi:uncharacterized protein
MFMANDGRGNVTVTVVVSLAPRHSETAEVFCDIHATVGDAVKASGLLSDVAVSVMDELVASVWGRGVPFSRRVEQGDRIELTRALTVDPKLARRERFTRQGAKSAGLFAKKRAGAKAGY